MWLACWPFACSNLSAMFGCPLYSICVQLRVVFSLRFIGVLSLHCRDVQKRKCFCSSSSGLFQSFGDALQNTYASLKHVASQSIQSSSQPTSQPAKPASQPSWQARLHANMQSKHAVIQPARKPEEDFDSRAAPLCRRALKLHDSWIFEESSIYSRTCNLEACSLQCGGLQLGGLEPEHVDLLLLDPSQMGLEQGF